MTPLERLAARELQGIKLGLETIGALVDALGAPHRTFLNIIVAGTNGKGSVTSLVAHGLHAAGLRVGRYSSPHLVHVRERYAIDGVSVTEDLVEAALQRVFDAEEALLVRGANRVRARDDRRTSPAATPQGEQQERHADLTAPATYFELTTAAAFEIFRDARVDAAVLEVGLGGRHDATNIVSARYAAITSIAMDHMAQLGDSLAAIAREKAGVIATGATVVSGVRATDARAVIVDACAANGATLVEAWRDVEVEAAEVSGETTVRLRTPTRTYGPLRLALRGRHQVDNALVAVRLLEVLEGAGLGGGTSAITSALTQTQWPGRLERRTLPGGVPLVLDGAHNPAGAMALAAWLTTAGITPVTLVFGCMRDKDVRGLLAPLLPLARRVIVTEVAMDRALPATSIATLVAQVDPTLPVQLEARPAEAVRLAAADGGPVVVAGSLLLVGAVRASLDA